MAKLPAYFGPHTGKLQIYVAGFDIGSGSFSAFADFNAAFAGSYDFLGQSGQFTIAINLSDQNGTSASGPCQVTLNGQTDNAATYKVNGKKLTFTTSLNDTPLDIYVKQKGTQVDNISGHNIWIG
jgi:hypothetical protein